MEDSKGYLGSTTALTYSHISFKFNISHDVSFLDVSSYVAYEEQCCFVYARSNVLTTDVANTTDRLTVSPAKQSITRGQKVGAAVGGALAFALVCVTCYLIIRRRRAKRRSRRQQEEMNAGAHKVVVNDDLVSTTAGSGSAGGNGNGDVQVGELNGNVISPPGQQQH